MYVVVVLSSSAAILVMSHEYVEPGKSRRGKAGLVVALDGRTVVFTIVSPSRLTTVTLVAGTPVVGSVQERTAPWLVWMTCGSRTGSGGAPKAKAAEANTKVATTSSKPAIRSDFLITAPSGRVPSGTLLMKILEVLLV